MAWNSTGNVVFIALWKQVILTLKFYSTAMIKNLTGFISRVTPTIPYCCNAVMLNLLNKFIKINVMPQRFLFRKPNMDRFPEVSLQSKISNIIVFFSVYFLIYTVMCILYLSRRKGKKYIYKKKTRKIIWHNITITVCLLKVTILVAGVGSEHLCMVSIVTTHLAITFRNSLVIHALHLLEGSDNI